MAWRVVRWCLALGWLLVACGGPSGPQPPPPWSLAWSRPFGTFDQDEASAVAVGAGRVAVVGTTRGALVPSAFVGPNAFVRVFDRDGDVWWTRLFETPYVEAGLGVAVDADGGVLLVGHTERVGFVPPGSTDALVARYESDGTEAWFVLIGEPAGAGNVAQAAAFDANGVPYVAGATTGTLGAGSAGGQDAFVRALDPATGAERWTRQFGTAGSEAVRAMAIDGAGRVVVAGLTTGGLVGASAGGADAFVRVYTADGDVAWTRQFGTALEDDGNGVAIDASGRILVSGVTRGALDGPVEGTTDLFVRAFDADGREAWTWQGGAFALDGGGSVATDPNGGAFVAGFDFGSLGGGGVLYRLDPMGNEAWRRSLPPELGFPAAIAAEVGAVHVAGRFPADFLAEIIYDAAVARFEP